MSLKCWSAWGSSFFWGYTVGNRYDLIHGNVTRVTNSAVLLETQDNFGREVEVWLPRSQIQDGTDIEIGLKQDLEVQTWLLEDKDLI